MKGRWMKRRKDRNLHVVREQEDPTDRIVREILEELNSEDGQYQDEEGRGRKKRTRWKLKFGLVLLAAAAVGVYLLVNLQTYSQVRITEVYENEGAANNNYREFEGGILKYSRDGISYLNQNGKEQWNHSYQIKSPFIELEQETGVIADKGGNDIFVIQKDGIKGEIHTAMPIEKISVSKQGIVCAVLKNDSSAEVICYDIKGNVLVEHKTSPAGTGYPLDVSLSQDGEVMQVLYFHTQVRNQSNVPFEVDFVTFKIVDKKVMKRTAIQEQIVFPLRAYNYATLVAGNKDERTMFTFDKFTIPAGKVLVVELNEKSGGRHQSFTVESEDIVRAKVINELKVK